VKAPARTELFSILSWRLSFLSGELPATLSFLRGGGDCSSTTIFRLELCLLIFLTVTIHTKRVQYDGTRHSDVVLFPIFPRRERGTESVKI
jgi:hypothetical protein